MHAHGEHANNLCNFAYLKFRLEGGVTIGYLRRIQFSRKAMEIWSDAWDLPFTRYIAVTFFSCGGHTTYHLCRISSAFCVPKIIQITWFLTVIHKLKGKRFYWDAVYILFSAAHGGFYTVSQKKQHTKLLPITSPNICGFSKKLTERLRSKFKYLF